MVTDCPTAKGLGQPVNGMSYKGKVKVNLAGQCDRGIREFSWVSTILESEEVLGVYEARMRMEEGSKDLKSLVRFDKIMN